MLSPVADLLQRLVRAPSVSGAEEPAVQVWCDFARALGFDPQVDGRNAFVEVRRNDGPAILLNSHLDTVKAGPTWTRDPWDGAVEDGRIHGLGANDAKASVAAQLLTAHDLASTGFAGNIVVCASCDEETGGAGMERIARTLPRYDAAIIGEPNDFAVAVGQRGLVKVRIVVPGQRAHASRPWQGHNAIHSAASVIAALGVDYLNVPGDLARATAQVTLVEGGTQSNVVPDRCILTLDCRTTPQFDNDAMLAFLNTIAQPVGASVEVVSSRFRPCHTDANAAVVKAALGATGAAQQTVFPSVCDLFWVSHVPSLVMGPGKPERSHQADEFVRIDELDAGVTTYAAAVRNWYALVAGG